MKKVTKSLKKKSVKTKKKTKKKATRKISAAKSSVKKLKKVLGKTTKTLIMPKMPDPAHSPGHKKMNIAGNFPDHSGAKVHLQESAVNNMANSDKMKRNNSKNRRIITGATIGKTGRIIIK